MYINDKLVKIIDCYIYYGLTTNSKSNRSVHIDLLIKRDKPKTMFCAETKILYFYQNYHNCRAYNKVQARNL